MAKHATSFAVICRSGVWACAAAIAAFLITACGGAGGASLGLPDVPAHVDPPEVSIASTSIAEGAGVTAVTLNVVLSDPPVTTASVKYQTADGSATVAGGDFTAATGMLVFAPGEFFKTISIDVLGDAIEETDETFTVTLSEPSELVLGSLMTGTVTITNDDFPALSVDSPDALEAAGAVTFTVSLSSPAMAAVSVAYATADGTASAAGGDYTAGSGTLTFAPGVTSQTVTVNIADDNDLEGDESLTLTLSNAVGATITTAGGTGTILNDDLPDLSITDTVRLEGNVASAPLTFTLTLSGPSASPVTVSYTTSDGTATIADNDYSAASATVTIPAGTMTRAIDIQIVGDTRYEGSETFAVTLSGVVGANLVQAAAAGTIQNDDRKFLFLYSGDTAGGLADHGRLYSTDSDEWHNPIGLNSHALRPGARSGAKACWTDKLVKKVIVWGGHDGTNYLASGALYDPATDAWSAPAGLNSGANRPSPRMHHCVAWTGTEMLVWGGYDGANYLSNGALYNPSSDTWAALPAAPIGMRAGAAAGFAKGRVVIWGGFNGTAYLADGAAYRLKTRAWVEPTGLDGDAANQLSARAWHTAVSVNGDKVLFWGGRDASGCFSDGATYDPSPSQNTWARPAGLSAGTLDAREGHHAVYSDGKMYVWGGDDDSGQRYDDGAVYAIVADIWSDPAGLSSGPELPEAREDAAAVWVPP